MSVMNHPEIARAVAFAALKMGDLQWDQKCDIMNAGLGLLRIIVIDDLIYSLLTDKPSPEVLVERLINLAVELETCRREYLDRFVNLCDMIAPGCVSAEIVSVSL